MKELNQLENRLRSWTPRHPSASIKQRLFPRAAEVEREVPDPINWRWLAPAMVLCVAALIVLANNPRSGLGEPASYRLTPTFALSNLDFATYFASSSQTDRNNDRNILHTTFEWTNGAQSSTTPHSFFDRTGYRE